MKRDLIKYSMQLAMIKQLLDKKLLTEKEYYTVRSKLMQDYEITSNIA